MSDMLFVGSGESVPCKPCVRGLIDHPSGTQFITSTNKVVGLSYQGTIVSLGFWTDPIAGIDFFGVAVTPIDIVKGIVFGIATRFAVQPLLKVEKPRKMSTGFKNGFIVGGLIGGAESMMDTMGAYADAGITDYSRLTGDVFSILLQGGIAGITNALLTKV